MKGFFLILFSSMSLSLHFEGIKKDNNSIVGEWTDLNSVGRDNFYRAIFYGTGSLIVVRNSGNFDAAYKVKSHSNNEITGNIIINGKKASFIALFHNDSNMSLKVKYDSVEQVHELTRTKRFDSNFHFLNKGTN